MRASFKTLLAAALVFGGAAAIQPSPASAQTGERDYYFGDNADRSHRYHRSYRNRYHAPAYRYDRRAYRNRYYGPAYRGYGYYGRNPYRHYYRRGYDGGAAVAGLIGGLAVGTIAGAVTSPFYYGAPAYPAYYRPVHYAPRCVIERRRVIDRYGRRVWQRVEVCY